jgi:hypothetical protein
VTVLFILVGLWLGGSGALAWALCRTAARADAAVARALGCAAVRADDTTDGVQQLAPPSTTAPMAQRSTRRPHSHA